MPCGSFGPESSSVEDVMREMRNLRSEMNTSHAKAVSNLKRECDKVTKLLCGVLKENPQIKKNKELSGWWSEHQKLDQSRADEKKRIAGR